MSLMDWLVIALVALIIGGALSYVIREKKRGRTCIGCPYGSSCNQKGGCCSGIRREDDGENDESSAPDDLK